jgi:hypothetical protein
MKLAFLNAIFRARGGKRAAVPQGEIEAKADGSGVAEHDRSVWPTSDFPAEKIGHRHQIGQQPVQYSNRTVATVPERALRTGLALRIIDPFLVRAPHHFRGHGHRAHLVGSKKQGDFVEYCRIVPDIAALGKPPPQLDRLGALRNDDSDSHLAGPLIVGSIEGDGADRIAAKAQFSLFV